MQAMRIDNPELSFKPKTLFLQKEDDLKYLIFADGFNIGWLVVRNGHGVVPNEKEQFTEADENYIIEEFLKRQ
jgi:hypothetical protein